MNRSLLPKWKAYILAQDTKRQGSFCYVYTNFMVDKVYMNKKVDLNEYVANMLKYMVVNDISPNICKFSREIYPKDTDLMQAYMDAVLKDYKELEDLLTAFLVSYFLSSASSASSIATSSMKVAART
jgi:hypothetical protein